MRGLVTELTQAVIADYVGAFAAVCDLGAGVFVGRDLRYSSPDIAAQVIETLRGRGVSVVDCGAVPTPALCFGAMRAGAAAVMVTGSHIPADRNGLKFYVPSGEISKADEARILAAIGGGASSRPVLGDLRAAPDLLTQYKARYVAAFGAQALAGLRVGVYQHSSVARDLLIEILAELGAEPVALGRSDVFVPIDSEAIDAQSVAQMAQWVARERLDALVSTDGDADRPIVVDETGAVIAGDVLGVLTAKALGARVVCTPVSSNSAVQSVPEFSEVALTKIGSPYVIAAMEAVLARDGAAKLVGFEANGGFLLGFTARDGALPPLMTRDAVLPIVAVLADARGRGLAAARAALPARFTAADRLTEIPISAASAFLSALSQDAARAAFLAPFGAEAGVDRTDGLRMSLADGRILHLRPSGNAPEFRVYVEAQTQAGARDMLAVALAHVRDSLLRYA